ncbi:MAG: amidase [Blastocatellia bacterium]|nr:amidase [Blastocatellia bacterium]
MKKKKTESNAPNVDKQGVRVDRRSFVKSLPAVGAATLAASYIDAPLVIAQRQNPPPGVTGQAQAPRRVTKEMLQSAERLIGVELTDAHREMALDGANRNLTAYESLRKIPVPLDTEPAIAFHPALPGKKFNAQTTEPAAGRPRLKITRPELPKISSVEDMAFWTVTQLAEAVRTRRVSSVELTRMYLARLKRYAPKLNCVITLTEELALEQAASADREIKRGRYRGPLHGIPWGAKDLLATKGIPTTWGAEPYRDQVIDHDAAVVERLREAGAVLLAKLSMGALAQGGLWFGGMTKNPWNTEQSSSGSSAGSASATSAGLVGFSIGTETLGSIVSPSSTCGVVGLRPTYGRVSRYGAMGLSWTMDKIGPICRGVEDCAVVLHAIYGPDGRDITVGDVPFNWTPDFDLKRMRIGYLKEEFERGGRGGGEERMAMYKEALDALRSAGANLEPLQLPEFSTGSLRIILVAEAATAFDDLTREGGVDKLSGQGRGDWPNTFRTSRFIPAVEYIRAQRARTLLMREMDALMSKWDVFVSPAPGSGSLLVTNLTGHPAVVLPCGFINNRPQAIMFTGGLYDETAPLRAALAFERATKWHTMHPKVDW